MEEGAGLDALHARPVALPGAMDALYATPVALPGATKQDREQMHQTENKQDLRLSVCKTLNSQRKKKKTRVTELTKDMAYKN